MDAQVAPAPRLVSGRSSRLAAMQTDLGKLISKLLPPLPLLWFGGSMLGYAMHRHHPNPRVGPYTRRAAYRLCAVMGAIIPIGTLFPGRGIGSWLIALGVGLAVIIPGTLWWIMRIRRETWPDIEPPANPPPNEEPSR